MTATSANPFRPALFAFLRDSNLMRLSRGQCARSGSRYGVLIAIVILIRPFPIEDDVDRANRHPEVVFGGRDNCAANGDR